MKPILISSNFTTYDKKRLKGFHRYNKSHPAGFEYVKYMQYDSNKFYWL